MSEQVGVLDTHELLNDEIMVSFTAATHIFLSFFASQFKFKLALCYHAKLPHCQAADRYASL